MVLLASHGEDGAFGWIINGRDVMTLQELLLRAEVTEERLEVPGSVRVGGPVSPEQVWLVYRAEDRMPDLEGQFEVGSGIVASASRKVLEAVAGGSVPRDIVGLVGYAGWAPMQLENEIRSGAWLPTDVDAGIVFECPRDNVWTRAYERMGTTPMAFTTRTVGSA